MSHDSIVQQVGHESIQENNGDPCGFIHGLDDISIDENVFNGGNNPIDDMDIDQLKEILNSSTEDEHSYDIYDLDQQKNMNLCIGGDVLASIEVS